MKINNIYFMALAIFSQTIFSSCTKDHDHDPVSGKGSISLEFDNVVGGAQLQLDSTGQTFTNGHGEKFSVTQLNYYVSNISFRKTDGSIFTVPQDSSYFMVRENDAESQEIMIPNLPIGDYNQVTFTIGVDSMRSTMDLTKRTGVLDPTFLSGHGMYWSWNSGYIFLKIEGMSPVAPDSLGNMFFYHIGGFGGYSSRTINNIKTVTLDFPTAATVRTDIKPDVHMLVDILKIFEGTSNLKINEDAGVMFGPRSVDIANNYAKMFMVHHIHNDH